MLRTVIYGAVVAVFAGILAFVGDTIGITTIWPVLLAAAIGLAAGPAIASRTATAAIGSIVGFLSYALLIGALPATSAATALVAVAAVAALTLVSALTGGALPLWAGLAGYAVFAGLYAPLAAASPTTFLTDAPLALVTALLALGLGAVAAIVAGVAGVAGVAPAVATRPSPMSEEVA